MKKFVLSLGCLLLLASPALAGEEVLIAAASDLQFAMSEVAAAFRSEHPDAVVKVTYGSSGNFYTVIRQGAPFDLYFSADVKYPDMLQTAGLSATPPKLYAEGRIVLMTPPGSSLDPRRGLELLNDPAVKRIAIANPEHAPYGARAKEALEHYGVWDQVQPKLVLGENISQTAQFVQTGNADVGILALSLAKSSALKEASYWLIPAESHLPLRQAFIVTNQGAKNPLANAFAEFVAGAGARSIMETYGFVRPDNSN